MLFLFLVTNWVLAQRFQIKKYGGRELSDKKEASANMRSYPTLSGHDQKFDISNTACSAFGFLHDQKVQTPDGRAIVLGVAPCCCDKCCNNGKDQLYLWFKLEKKSGACYWSSCRTLEDFIREGFKLLDG